jgi:uncharacterized protein YegP (UPF0339 family)
VEPPLESSGTDKYIFHISSFKLSSAIDGTMPTEPTFEVYQDRASEWRWRLIASNGNIIADSGEGYASKQGVQRGIESVKRTAPEAPIRVKE